MKVLFATFDKNCKTMKRVMVMPTYENIKWGKLRFHGKIKHVWLCKEVP